MAKIRLEKWFTSGKIGHRKMCHRYRNGLQLQNMLQLENCVTEKCVTGEKQLGVTQKNGSEFKKCITVRKMGDSQKKMGNIKNNAAQLKNWIIARNLGILLKNGSQLEQFLTVRKMSHIQKNGPHLEKCVTEKEVTIRKMCPSKKDGSQLEKWVSVYLKHFSCQNEFFSHCLK